MRLAIVDAGGRLTTIDANGGSVVSYGAPGVGYRFPAWSPDGTRIAAIATTETGTAVHVFKVRGQRSTEAGGATPASDDASVVYEAAASGPFYVYWAPDGRRVAFLTTEGDAIALRVGDADGATPVRIVREGAPLYWAWAAADRMLVHVGGEGHGSFLGELGLDGSNVAGTGVVPGGFRAPARSVDGRYRGYVVPGSDTPERIVAEAADGSDHHEVAVLGGAVVGFDPRGRDLAFIAPSEAGPEVTLPIGPLRVLDAGSGSVRTLLPGDVLAFFWAPDGRTVAALRIAPRDDTIALVHSTRPVATDAGLALDLLFVDPASGTIRSKSAVRLAETFSTQVLPYFDQYALSHRLWAPDSRSIVLPLIVEDGTTSLAVIRADGSGSRRIADGDMGFWSP